MDVCRTCLCFVALLGIVSAANLGYLPRQQQQLQQLQQPKTPTQTQTQSQNQQAYYYNPPSASTMAALRRIVLGHLQRFQQADRERQRALAEVQQPGSSGMSYRQPVVAQTISLDFHAVPPNTPTPKNYAMNFLPEGRDVVPGTSYIPLRLLLIRR